MPTPSDADESPASRRAVRVDLWAGTALLLVVIGGDLVWRVSDAGLISALARR
ncbi:MULTISPECIES: hypothetical protein [Aeromicrobium]|uniref:hypothetical protein n=1 Tax=Aeromicrobium TaxID=2040 RepID=UPI0012FC85A2|nr:MULTISPECIES: hypothetical protein [Aeromicrobium]MBD8607019.1 hypothetical protein [Aeromicrobium sp. CFBP 8757]MCL8252280.1 hypothetical protein [Aeromicrobium fastidiosum]